jgi:peptide/nickel transport system substrate-binding protein
MATARRLVGPIVGEPVLMGNHLYPAGSRDYRDNSAGQAFDPEAARRELDALGWRLPGSALDAVRVRDGKPLELRYVSPSGNPISDQISRLVLGQLASIGVRVKIETVPSAEYFERHVRVGSFDLTGFIWVQTPTPFSSSTGIYTQPNGSDVQQNYGRISDPEITSLFAAGMSELDDAKRAELGNRIDSLIWKQVHHLPLYPNTGAYAVRASMANFGAPGYADIDYIGSGFTR